MSTPALDTIVAPATPLATSALAIVRIDGPLAHSIIKGLGAPKDLAERRAVFVRLETAEGPLDEVIVISYVAPKSFTGNDLIEITCHGSPLIVGTLVKEVIDRGARMAEPGEFTERAVLNGKLDLVQAEAIGDLINSRTTLQAQLSLSNLGGTLSRWAGEIRADLLFLIARLEGALDFADEGYTFITDEEAMRHLDEDLARIRSLAETARRGRGLRDGLTAVILGRPNAGKSTLLNHLCGSERAIVTPTPGTTRDLIRETVIVGGLPVTFIDTAGLRTGGELVEEIGQFRALEAASKADLVIWLEDSSDPDLTDVPSEARDAILVFSKVDQKAAPPEGLGISARTGAGMTVLWERLDREVRDRFRPPEGSPLIVNARQEREINEAGDALRQARLGVSEGLSEEMILVDLYAASSAIGRLTGAISSSEIQNEIFSNFCIGK
ncbi:MAG TPA: tRNA uridine-5-carboxymethylaminomethyl(34) synthesis GTPase MnmE [Thermoanaerobaculia bacterium]|nr:tRNA uridine-5-carboxymethylaminomethyl(34) synthesis GTPase MnmE [Thermoanaerobaculia bacterium]